MDEKNTNKKDVRKKLITVDLAIKCAKVSAYCLKHSANGITPKEIEKGMLTYCDGYSEELISLLLKAYEKEDKKKC